jgi:hypothetical protein
MIMVVGWTTEYYSWRVMQALLGFTGLIIFITFYFLFPETSQPGSRGIDKMKAANGIDSSSSFIFINPLQSLWLLRSPTMLLTVRSSNHNAELITWLTKGQRVSY